MNLEKYTQKAQEALLAAERLSQNYKHQVVEPIHLLLALVQQQDGFVRAIITKVSGGTQGIQVRDQAGGITGALVHTEMDHKLVFGAYLQVVGRFGQRLFRPPRSSSMRMKVASSSVFQ